MKKAEYDMQEPTSMNVPRAQWALLDALAVVWESMWWWPIWNCFPLYREVVRAPATDSNAPIVFNVPAFVYNCSFSILQTHWTLKQSHCYIYIYIIFLKNSYPDMMEKTKVTIGIMLRILVAYVAVVSRRP